MSVTVLEFEQQQTMLATKPTKKHEILFFFVQFRGFRGHQSPIKEIEFLFRSDWTLAAGGAARMKLRQNGSVFNGWTARFDGTD